MGDPPSFKESLDTSLVEIAESPTLKAGLSLISKALAVPGLGEWIIGRGEVIARSRLEEFFVLLQEELEDLRRQGVTDEQFETYFESEEWFDLFCQTLAQALKTRSHDRRKYSARILKGA